jgi:mannitol 2-dehydrogenase
MTIKLNQSALKDLPASISLPTYDRSAISPGILHIGVGNFHRAHQASYLDRLFNLGLDHDWGLIGAGIKPYDAAMRSTLQQQDWLTTVVELDPDGLTAAINGAMVDFLEVNSRKLIEKLADPQIRIVSLTITEGGYFIDAKTGGFQSDHPDIQRDVDNPSDPQTVFGILIAGLALRRQRAIAPFTIMSCDNLPENGHVTKQVIVGLAEAMAPEMAAWIGDNVAFPSGMVDCITPATSDRERKLVAEHFGIEDASPVACEPFRQWVLEDNFPQGRPALEKVGVEFVDDVSPFELLKLRILNGGHAAIAYPSALLGLTYVHQAMANPLVSAFLRKLQFAEIIPTVPAVPGVDFETYFATVERRFANDQVADTIPRLCLDGSNRQPKFILPAIADRLRSGQPIDGLSLAVAFWCRYCAGTNEMGETIVIDDVQVERLRDHAIRARHDPAVFLEMSDIFGQVAMEPEFRERFANALNSIWKNGTRSTLQTYLSFAAL